MKKISVILLLLGTQLVFSQSIQKEESQQKDPAPGIQKLSVKETPVEFPGGMAALRSHISSTFDPSIIKGSGTFKSVTKLLILPDGSMSSISTTGDNPSMNKEMTRVIKAIRTKWKPATRDGQPIETEYQIPMTISLQ